MRRIYIHQRTEPLLVVLPVAAENSGHDRAFYGTAHHFAISLNSAHQRRSCAFVLMIALAEHCRRADSYCAGGEPLRNPIQKTIDINEQHPIGDGSVLV